LTLRPTAIKALRNALAPAKLRDRILAAQAIEYDADLLFS
jgi:hypothetical protein